MPEQETVQSLIDQRLDRYDYYRSLILHPTMGMAARGYTAEEIGHALTHVEVMQDFYEDLLEQM